ncbi:Por secretion system C-terminal sorting domain-containing protein [Cruoricaptor ignavus]|uniref:Por secretion system C-terminal sorting domain-containing protein n=1 Tax=Cruoricaptor ignavus TaxID=1118202 RepID=A0A1M6FGF5_9FLAO|nr:zinc-dependent metalloprotease family protein [Cruoricaptor ignavus]SHI96765.1 Por secretion system C-terminal sorting domain-containing protein [Cruoricaptor ignavus]
MKSKSIFLSISAIFLSQTVNAQWTKSAAPESKNRNVNSTSHYTLDLEELRTTLSRAQLSGRNSKPVIVRIPTLDGAIEEFEVYSFPVVEKAIAERYKLGSYVGKGVNDPSKYIRFSVAPNDFQSMVIKNGRYEFVEPLNKEKSIYGVFPKSKKTEGDAFECKTTESLQEKRQIDNLKKKGFGNDPTEFSRMWDSKYRTMRLVISTTGEYTHYFGGREGAIAQVNATLTRVNGIFERDFGLHLILQDYPELIYTNYSTDPYSPAYLGVGENRWADQLQRTLTKVVGEENYDIGHLFGASGGGGMAGCIGCVCISPAMDENGVPTSWGKGSAYTSPADMKPFGDAFDIDYVAHEMGHQLGANHTFAYDLEGTGTNMEPGSGSTIMGYAGIRGEHNVQEHSDPFFHIVSIVQVGNNLLDKTCDVEAPIINRPPKIQKMADVTIPKETAFALTAIAEDPDGDPLLYSWQQTDNAKDKISYGNLGTRDNGPLFRVFNPTVSPTRFFPKMESILAGNLDNSKGTWESVPKVPRLMKFHALVYDNNPTNQIAQNDFEQIKVNVGNDGPFKVKTEKVFMDYPTSLIQWDVANTNKAPYNTQNVKIDYTKDGGATWNTLITSTANDGEEILDFRGIEPEGTEIHLRVSAVENIFLTVSKVLVRKYPTETPLCITQTSPANNAENAAYPTTTLSWTAKEEGEKPEGYDIYLDTNPNPTTLLGSTEGLTIKAENLLPETKYYWKIVPKNLAGNTTACQVFSFITEEKRWCEAGTDSTSFEKIGNVKFAGIDNSSTNTVGYEDFTSISASVEPGKTYDFEAKAVASSVNDDKIYVWIDFNRNKSFDDDGELVLVTPPSKSPWNGQITIPLNTAPIKTRMRVRLVASKSTPNPTSCGNAKYGQVEDYSIEITNSLSVASSNPSQGITLYPNPVSEILTVQNAKKDAQYSIYTADGKLHSKGKLNNGAVDVSAFAGGVYIINVANEDKNISVKFIKK